ncbi:ketopantoate reductase family protein [Metallumcola ferriviriculae]|uniref:2-dehydropantoate 2-reductase n=1 Tax=Metallumcola ferriviriculae TaxID=3039180 RepID=A0AAU0UJS5_9FIRM|nr:ketopantoate reductase family protein [Desulfitibacteraceae bacterium MK1]
MREINTVSIIGLGAVGAAYAARLHDMDPDCLRVIADNDRSQRYSKEGFIINGKRYRFNYIAPDEKVLPADLLLIASKYHHLEQVTEDIRQHIGSNTIILSLLNGISSEDIVGQRYGMDKILYSMCLGIDAVREDEEISFVKTGKVYFGEKDNEVYSEKVRAVKALFDRAAIPYIIPQNMLRTLWWKFMVNVGINQVSAVLRAPYGVFQRFEEPNELMESAMREVVRVSQQTGVYLTEDDIRDYREVLQAAEPRGKTSMLQDIEAGRKTEVEMLAGALIELGHEHGVDTPINEALYQAIRTLEQMTSDGAKEFT